MRIGIRRSLAAGKVCTALLLGVSPIALVVPGVDVAFSQSGTGSHLLLYTAIDLHPLGFISSGVNGIYDGQQVGVGSTDTEGGHEHALLWRGSAGSVVDLTPHGVVFAQATATCGGQQVGYDRNGSYDHALLWRGTAASVVDLHPRGFTDSETLGTSGQEQVGFGIQAPGECHALLWHGTAASVVDLHPRGFGLSQALGTSAEEQVGWGWRGPTGGPHALLWRGSADSVVDLHPHGFEASKALATTGGQQVGYGSGPATGNHNHALLWHDSAASAVDLNPRGFISSEALGTNGKEQVGEGMAPWVPGHALLWRGGADSVVELHAFLPPGFVWSSAYGIDAAGDIVGSASAAGKRSPSHAILWKRNASTLGTSREQNTTRC